MKKAVLTTYSLLQLVLRLPFLFRPSRPPVGADRLIAFAGKSIHPLTFTPDYSSAFVKTTFAELL